MTDDDLAERVYGNVVMPPAARAALLCRHCEAEPIALYKAPNLHVMLHHDSGCPSRDARHQ